MESLLSDINPAALAAILVGLLVVSAFFSGSETALLGFNWLRLRYLARKGNRRAHILEQVLTRKDRLIGTLLVGNNVVNVAASAIATALAIAYFGDRGILIATAGMTFVLLIFGEIAPKTLAIRHTEAVGLAVAPFAAFLVRVLAPVVLLVTALSNLLLRLFGTRPEPPSSPSLSEEEIRSLLSESGGAAAVAEGKRSMLRGIFQLSRQTAREVMVPRTRVKALDVSTDIRDAARRFVATGFTRMPVYRETLDHILGIAHARDALDVVVSDRAGGLGSILRETFFVPESMTLENLLFEFQRKRTHMAVVVDEYGGVEGILTLEDVLEEIVGEIRDEHDLEGESIRFLPGGEALVAGIASLRDVNGRLGLKLPTTVDTTLGGFAMTSLGHIPEVGESFVREKIRFTIERMSRNRVLLVRATPLDDAPKPRR